MNNKAQISGIGIAIVVAMFLFIIGMININFIKDEVTRTRGDLNCSLTTISDGSKLTCLLTDLVIPYFIIIIISAAGGLITSKFTV